MHLAARKLVDNWLRFCQVIIPESGRRARELNMYQEVTVMIDHGIDMSFTFVLSCLFT